MKKITINEYIAKLKELMDLNLKQEAEKAERKKIRKREWYKRWKKKKKLMMKETKIFGKD